jgi:non-specific serine/threonine protein kinase
LREKINSATLLPIDEVINIVSQVCDGLAAAHQAGITHRDLKPENLMIAAEGRVKILDFGLAKLRGVTKLTADATTLGTISYMSPEQTQGEEVDHRTDIWSLGVVLYEMLTGQLPFRGEYELAVVYSILNEEPQPVSSLCTDVPLVLETIVHKALAKKSDERYQRISDLLVALKAFKQNSVLENVARKTTARKISLTSALVGLSQKRRIVMASLLVLALAAVTIFVIRLNREDKPESRAKKKMLVVLPFENLGQAEEAYFAAGMTEEITSRISAVRGLGVISRTSAVQYDRIGKTTKQIGEDLGVDYVLEGTVRWDRGSGENNRVRITPTLIRVSDDTQLWSQRYDEELNDIFTVQSEIASQAIQQLGITLLGSERQALEAKPTENLEAYNAYLRGKSYTEGPDINIMEQNCRLTMQMFERAVALDPDFACLCRAFTSSCTVVSSWFDRSEERLSMEKTAANQSLELQPGLPEAYLALGKYYYLGLKEYEQALAAFALAEKALPNNTEILEVVAYILRRQGNFKSALENLKSALELNPRKARLAEEIGWTCTILRSYTEADRYYQRSIALAPDQITAYVEKAWNFWLWQEQRIRRGPRCSR